MALDAGSAAKWNYALQCLSIPACYKIALAEAYSSGSYTLSIYVQCWRLPQCFWASQPPLVLLRNGMSKPLCMNAYQCRLRPWSLRLARERPL
jgi:hypothetical protein